MALVGGKYTDMAIAGGLLVAVAGGIYFFYKGKKAVEDSFVVAKEVVTTKLNPVSQENIVNEAANSLANWVTGDEPGQATIGTRLYDWVHSDDDAEEYDDDFDEHDDL